ncbi:tyrosinase family protein [uncultured Tateyamaria sp.]|uniref:tyrosinase family protein n=1 Tax=uncultured Tateyamaria sp. TaxID=455651 RepID=UPI00263530BB|nr:tyrosinase family protein [uncultured Tateyamaria sp.]
MTHRSIFTPSRRTVLKTGAAAGVAAFAPAILRAQGKRVRKNVASPEAAKDVQSYKDAVAAMLKLPADDPRNWYRVAMVHLMDCPHGNWWFTTWHRGYLGYFEQLCREMSGNHDFMLPYWDWTASPDVPEQMFGAANPLDPVNYVIDDKGTYGYIPDFATFENQVRGPMEALWNAMTVDQKTEQAKRMNPDFKTFWSDPANGAVASFQVPHHARLATAANPSLDVNALPLVTLDTILSALAPTDFAGDGVTFENEVTSTHQGAPHGSASFSMLSNSHNKVHNSIGGYLYEKSEGNYSYEPPYGLMTNNLSPLDPVFFLHHGNIDRLWDVWTRKQISIGQLIRPNDDLIDDYKTEPFLFFVNGKGEQVTMDNTAWDYFDMARFDYTYEPGSGEEVVRAPASKLVAQRNAGSATLPAGAALALRISEGLAQSVEQGPADAQHFAQVTFIPPAQAQGQVFRLFISPEGADADMDPNGPEFAGSFSFFGQPHHPVPTTFTLPIDKTLDQMQESGVLEPGAPIAFTLVIAGSGTVITSERTDAGQLQSVDVQVLSSS